MRISDWSSDVCSSDLLGDLRFPENPRSRKFSLQELEWFLKALVDEKRWVQRGMLLWLLTAARISEAAQAKSAEYVNGVRSDERRVGKECGRTCISRWSPYHSKQPA